MSLKKAEIRSYNPSNSLLKALGKIVKREGLSESEVIKNLLMSHPTVKQEIEKL